jgi:ABC-type branched-subunit amino acid transport system ATPase component
MAVTAELVPDFKPIHLQLSEKQSRELTSSGFPSAVSYPPNSLLLNGRIQITLIEKISEFVRWISKERELGVLLVEQNLELALATSVRCYVIEKGQVARCHSRHRPEELKNA